MHRLLQDHESGGHGMRTSDLSSLMGVKPPTVTAIVNILESCHLVERQPDSDDRRSVRIRLSPLGLKVARENRERAFVQISRLVRKLGLEESRSFVKSLKITADFLIRERAEHDSDREAGMPENNHG